MDRPLRLALRVKPGARLERVGGSWDGPFGQALVVAVRAAAVQGKANEAVCAAVAGALGVRARDVAVVRGERGRDKLVDIRNPPAGAGQLVRALLGSRMQ